MTIYDLARAEFTQAGDPARVSIQAPIDDTAVVELARASRIFRKQVLKVGKIKYQGDVLDFTSEYLDGLALAHKEQPFPVVPLVFAGKDNSHTQAIENIRGEILGFERNGDALDAIVRASNDEAARLLRENPKIGCSVRIEQPLERADGKSWPAAVQHVLATANPIYPGLTPWQSVDLAADDRTVIDLSAYDFADGEDTTHDKEIEMADEPSLFTPEETTQLRELLAAINAETPAETAEAPVEKAENEVELPTDEELAQIAALFGEEAEPEPAVALANDNPQAIELAAQVDAQAIELAKLRGERDTERFEKLRDRFAHELGVPPAITELARPLLCGTHSIELANGNAVDAGQIVEKVITELAKARLVDLSSDTVYDADAATRAQAEDKARADWSASYAEQFGI